MSDGMDGNLVSDAEVSAVNSVGITDGVDPMIVLRRLYRRLVLRRPTINLAAEYYDGHQNLAFASEKFLDAFGGLFHAFADNWCGIVVDAPADRLGINGFRVNEKPAADKRAKQIWERNELDLQFMTATIDGIGQGAYY